MTPAETLTDAATEVAASSVALHCQNRHGATTVTDIGVPLAALLREQSAVAAMLGDSYGGAALDLARAILGEVSS